MTTAFAALLIGVAGAALVLALVAYFWVNRTPSLNERFDEHGRVPLFGVDLVATPANGVPTTGLDERFPAPGPIDPTTDRANEVMVREVDTQATESNAVSGQPVAIDNAAAHDHRFAPKSDSPKSSQHEKVDVPIADAPNVIRADPSPINRPVDHRLGGRGWGASPGWPVPEVATPRYVPSVPPNTRSNGAGPPPAPLADTSNGNGVYSDGIPGSMVEGHRLRFSTPAEGTLQFLPGRLEISSGLDTGREIRFVRLPGPNGTEVTFGRNEGPLYRHIQLRDQTVSREHARMTLIDGHWLLTNLSKTNPVAHNGRVLGFGEHQLLDDGDRLDMGEVIFSFRSR